MININNITICSSDFCSKTTEELIEMNYTPIDYFLRNLNKNLTVSDKYIIPLNEITIIKFNSCNISSNIFSIIFRDLFESVKNNIEIIDVQHNPFGFGIDNINEIIDILKYPKLKYINLIGTHLALSNIKPLITALKNRHLEQHINKIIFIDKTYLWSAQHKFTYYKNISPNFYDEHMKYFDFLKI